MYRNNGKEVVDVILGISGGDFYGLFCFVRSQKRQWGCLYRFTLPVYAALLFLEQER